MQYQSIKFDTWLFLITTLNQLSRFFGFVIHIISIFLKSWDTRRVTLGPLCALPSILQRYKLVYPSVVLTHWIYFGLLTNF